MNEKINLQELTGLLAEKSGVAKKEAEAFLREFFDLMAEALVSEKQVKIKNLGTFKLTEVEDRESVDVRTGERVLIPSHLKIIYSPDKYLSETVNEPFALFEPVEVGPEEVGLEEALMIEEKKIPEIEIPEGKIIEPEREIQTQIPEREIIENKSSSLESSTSNGLNQKKYNPVMKKIKWKIIRFVIVMFTMIGVFSYFILKDNSNESNDGYQILPSSKTAFELANEDSLRQMNSGVSDSVPEKIDSVTSIPPDTNKVVLLKETPKESTIETPKTVAKKDLVQIVAKIPESKGVESGLRKRTIAPGERLTVIALEEYGNKIFWVYLYEENKSLIKNPNNVIPGLEIVIPPASKYKIDKNNPESVSKAQELSKSYR